MSQERASDRGDEVYSLETIEIPEPRGEEDEGIIVVSDDDNLPSVEDVLDIDNPVTRAKINAYLGKPGPSKSPKKDRAIETVTSKSAQKRKRIQLLDNDDDDDDDDDGILDGIDNEILIRVEKKKRRAIEKTANILRDLVADLHQKNKHLQQELKKATNNLSLCAICLEKEITTAIVPCFHVVLCEVCAVDLDNCPICRIEKTQTQRVYL